MLVTDDIEATIRAYLQGDKEEYQQRNASMSQEREVLAAYKAMIIAAFLIAVQHKFSKDSPRDEIIDYVAAIRSRADSLVEAIDPTAAERMISSVFTSESTRDIDSNMKVSIQMFFATAIVNDDGIQGQDLDNFIAATRELANELLN
jgi:hypothetical protein